MLRSLAKELPGETARREILYMNHSLNFTLGVGLAVFKSLSVFCLGGANEILCPSDWRQRKTLAIVTDQAASCGKMKGYLAKHLRVIGIDDPLHRLHNNSQDAASSAGFKPTCALLRMVNDSWLGHSWAFNGSLRLLTYCILPTTYYLLTT